MPDTPRPLKLHDVEAEVSESALRRIRHITCIQVRNFTPFPVRDAFASALSKPSEQSQFTAHGHLSDDLDVTLTRKRNRRISATSLNTLRSETNRGEEDGHGMGESRGRHVTASSSRVSFSGGGSLGPSGNSAGRASNAPTIRPAHRPRTSSMVSSISASLSHKMPPASALSPPAVPFSSMLPDNSQGGLEKVIKSRLVETFIAVTISNPQESEGSSRSSSIPRTNPSRPSTPPLRTPPLRQRASTISHKPKQASIGNTPRKGSRPPLPNAAEKTTPIARRNSTASASPRFPAKPAPYIKSSATTTSVHRSNGQSYATSPSSSSHKPFVKSASPGACPQSSTTSPRPSRSPTTDPQTPIPDYLSSIHRPSTNPSFPIDAKSGSEFAPWTDLSGDKLKVEVWGKVGTAWPVDGKVSTSNGKGKERESDIAEDEGQNNSEWKVLEQWDVDLADLIPLPEDLAQLPSNTLVMTLSPPGQAFYLPPPSGGILSVRTRSPSPSAGYTSDPESELRRVKQAVDLTVPPMSAGFVDGFNTEQPAHAGVIALSRRRHRRGAGILSESTNDAAKTAGWQDLFNLITLQSCILDNEASLSDVVLQINKILEEDAVSALKREVSEREYLVDTLRENERKVTEGCRNLREDIEARKDRVKERREMLNLALENHEEDRELTNQLEEEVSKERDKLSSLRARFPPTRTTLLTTLSAIFPIELRSPPDLLYTILDVPLPIPLTPTDPAPPLSLPAHKDVTEDTVATALGYAAQVVQLLAAYMGKGLVYPVTCIGSRSLIRDGISAMVGPRMFPLFSKGVDTYRFEYGVFLLNKDIEMLMADRDLRAPDMRHTLFNLFSLLLTLTDGEGAHLHPAPSLDSPVSSEFSGLESPSRSISPVDSSLTTPKAIDIDLPVDLPVDNTPPASGSSTPTSAAFDPSKKTGPFSSLGFPPLAGFLSLRSRYPSASIRPASKPVTETSDDGMTNGAPSTLASHTTSSEQDEGGEDDEDRRTIRGVVMDETEDEGKLLENGNAHHPKEKTANGETPSSPPPTPPPLVAPVN